jgi:hypothetical protein
VSAEENAAGRRFWWVNQNQTYRQEIAGGFMWSPKRNANGARNQFYENMREVAIGDVVFSFYGTRVQHVGVATAPAETAPKPDFGIRLVPRPAGRGRTVRDDNGLRAVVEAELGEDACDVRFDGRTPFELPTSLTRLSSWPRAKVVMLLRLLPSCGCFRRRVSARNLSTRPS